jgi:hypothetical protein
MNYLAVFLSSCGKLLTPNFAFLVLGGALLIAVSKKRREAAMNYASSTMVHLQLAVYTGQIKANLPYRFDLIHKLFVVELEKFYTEKKVPIYSIAWLVSSLNCNLLQ